MVSPAGTVDGKPVGTENNSRFFTSSHLASPAPHTPPAAPPAAAIGAQARTSPQPRELIAPGKFGRDSSRTSPRSPRPRQDKAPRPAPAGSPRRPSYATSAESS